MLYTWCDIYVHYHISAVYHCDILWMKRNKEIKIHYFHMMYLFLIIIISTCIILTENGNCFIESSNIVID